MKRNSMLAAAAVFLVGLAATGCERDPAGSGMARVTVLLTDAPADFATAEVEILEIYLQGGNGEAGGRTVLFSGPQIFDLLELQNGVVAELAQAIVTPGTYGDLRLVVGGASITTEGGATYSTADGTLHCPSCAQSGLKIKAPGGSIQLDEGSQSLLIDFDVAQSFGHAAGHSGRWIMHPVIRATRMEGAGRIDGTVTLAENVTLPECGGAAVNLTHFVPTATEGDITLTGNTDADGNLRIHFVPAGTYTMGFASPVAFDNGDSLAFTASADPASLQLATGATGTVSYQITGATCTVSTD